MEEEAKDEVDEAVADGDKTADKVNEQVEKEDGDFDPDAPEEEAEPALAADAEAGDDGKCCCNIVITFCHTMLPVHPPAL